MYSFAYGKVFSLAPKKYNMGSRNIRETAMNSKPMMMFRLTTFPRTLLAPL